MLSEYGTLPALSQHQAALRSCGAGSGCMQLWHRLFGCLRRQNCSLRWRSPLPLGLAACCWMPLLDCPSLQRNTALLYDHLCCCLISSVGFPPASSPHPPILLTVQTPAILPASEDSAKLSGAWKQLSLCVWGDTTCDSDMLFPLNRSSVDSPGRQISSSRSSSACFFKSEVSLQAQSDSEH